MYNFKEMKIEYFTKELAKANHIPSGGSVSSLNLALINSLILMILEIRKNFFTKKLNEFLNLKNQNEKDKKEIEKLKETLKIFDETIIKEEYFRQKSLKFIDNDAKNFDEFMLCFKIKDKNEKSLKIQEKSILSASVPLETLKTLEEIQIDIKFVEKIINNSLLPDLNLIKNLYKTIKQNALDNLSANIEYMNNENKKKYTNLKTNFEKL